VSRSYLFHPDAAKEAFEAQDWYAARDEFASTAFGHEVDLVIRRITEAPDRYPPYLYGTRRILLPRFPFGVVYLEHGYLVWIVAVAHQRRRPGHWRQRLAGGAT
jgi:toxin ParE1/3/4